MESIIQFIPQNLHPWILDMSNKDIAQILTTVGNASQFLEKIEQKTEQNKTSSLIGKLGELEVAEIIRKKYNFLDTAKSGKRGDFIITIGNIRLLIEVKKYRTSVPSSEIEKFYRDIESNASVSGGLFISLTSSITGVRRDMEHSFKIVNGSKIPIIFLSLMSMCGTIANLSIHAAIEILQTEIKSISSSIDIDDNIEHSINNIITNLDFLSQCRLVVSETQNMMNKQLAKLTQNILAAEINIKNSVRNLQSKVKRTELKCSKSPINDILSDFKIGRNTSHYNMLTTLLEDISFKINPEKKIIQADNKKFSVKILKTCVKVIIPINIKDTIHINGEWAYSNKKLTIVLSENTVETIIKLVK